MYQDKKIFILGMARSGYEVAKVLRNYTDKILITDNKEQDQEHVKELTDMGIQYIMTDNPSKLLDDSFDILVKNPGINYKQKCVVKAKNHNIAIINEVEVAYNLLPKSVKIIGVTGSNGKTTTTTLIYEMLKGAKKSVHLGGNIGIPVVSILKNIKKNDILVLEISSHQLQDLKNFNCYINILTNLSEVHLDFFENYENYKNYKKRIFKNNTKDDIAILNYDNQDVLSLTKNINAKKLYFSTVKKQDAYIENNKIYYKNELIITTDDIRLQGLHNYENIMCAIMTVKQFGVTNETIKEVLNNFYGVEHRLEFVTKINNRCFYNDSKATNIKSTSIALNSFSVPIILLLGGLDRGHSFQGLTPYLSHVKQIISYGETKERIKQYADTINIDCVIVNNLEEATKVAYNLSEEGDIILLSPACASWDQYSSFEQRGEEFKKIINELN
ncbi:MAG: UDP-N-acetylmuramoyl-L-alanine--D-glutamate ligase [Bacilli bacterium]